MNYVVEVHLVVPIRVPVVEEAEEDAIQQGPLRIRVDESKLEEAIAPYALRRYSLIPGDVLEAEGVAR